MSFKDLKTLWMISFFLFLVFKNSSLKPTSSIFKKTPAPFVVSNTFIITGQSILQCSRLCSFNYIFFIYETETSACKCGSILNHIPNEPPVELWSIYQENCSDFPDFQTYLTSSGESFCLHFSTLGVTFEDAETECAAKQSRMVVLETLEKQNLIFNSTEGRRVWIGLNDRIQEDVFVWADGSLLSTEQRTSTLNWGSNDTGINNRNGNQDCIIINTVGLLNDKACTSNLFRYVCEIPLTACSWAQT